MISPLLLKPRLPEVGYIKIGGLEEKVRKTDQGKEWQAPTKFDFFAVTKNERDQHNNLIKDEEVHSLIGKEPTELEIMLIYPKWEDNLYTCLAEYAGKKWVCRGSGEGMADQRHPETGVITQVPCPCPKMKSQNGKAAKCKPHAVLTCLLAQSSITGGVYRFSTTGWNSIRNLQSALLFISLQTRGRVNGIPLFLQYRKRDATVMVKGVETQKKIPVVSLVYKGNPKQMLLELVKSEREKVRAGLCLETMEDQERRRMEFETNGPLSADEVTEFHVEDDEDDISDVPAEPVQSKGPGFEDALNKLNQKSQEQNQQLAKGKEKPPAKSKQATEAKSAYACIDCGFSNETSGTPVSCKCGSKNIKVVPTLAEAQKIAADAVASKSQGSAPSNPPEANPPQSQETPDEKAAIVQKICDLRGKHSIGQGVFMGFLSQAIQKPKALDAAGWSLEEAKKILAVIEAKFGGQK